MANLECRNEPNGLVFELQLQGLDSFPGIVIIGGRASRVLH